MIYVVFSKSDFYNISKISGKGDIIIGDIENIKLQGVEIIKPYIDRKSENELISNLKIIFKELNYDHIKGFINVFYEASILPLSKYIYTLSNVISECKKKGFSFDVMFPSKILNSSKESVFFLSEHETQFQFLYKRQLIFQPYLESYCNKNNLSYSYYKSFVFSDLFVTLQIRRTSVYTYRFFKSLYKSFKHWKDNSYYTGKDIDFIAVTRLVRKSEYIQSLLLDINYKPLLISEENFMSLDSNKTFCKNFYDEFSFPINTLNKYSPKRVLFYYIKSLFSMYLKRKISIKFKGIEINLNNALKEVLINRIDLIIYIESFIKYLKLISEPKLKLIITTELKSQYAYADAYIAHHHGFRCFHIMDCDQADHIIPYPVFGNYLITNTRNSMITFKKSWSRDSSKVLFFGNLFANKLKKFSNNNKSKKNVICFFTTARRTDDKIAIEELFSLHELKKITLIIKLHPRDNFKLYKKYKTVEIIKDEEISRVELFKKFSHAVTYSSAIIHDLMIFNKQFLIIISNLESYFNENVHNKNFEKLNVSVDNLSNVKYLLKTKKNIFIEYQKDYIHNIVEPDGLKKLRKKMILVNK